MSSPGVSSSAPSRRQKRMGPAPFASFEDLSDELESPDETAASVVRLPGIREDITPNTPSHHDQPPIEFVYSGISLVGGPTTPGATTAPVPISPPSTTLSSLSTPQGSLMSARMSLQTPSTPRIDISRASSSSHHEDSRDSTPERELFEGHDQSGAKLGLAFKEEGTLDLRSSTEELDFHEPQEKLKVKQRPQSPCIQDDSLGHQRKDSQSSEIGLLSISGRTSRISSIGSQGSAQSRISNVSHLSIISGQSGRSPSPHKMLLETSFCGPKPPVGGQHATGQSGTKTDSDMLEKVLLSRKHDPREAILAEGISMDTAANRGHNQRCLIKEKPVRKDTVQNVKSDIKITVDKPSISDSNNKTSDKIPRTIIAESGIEYIYIPLKGPLPQDLSTDTTKRVRVVKSADAARSRTSLQSKDTISTVKAKSPLPSTTKSHSTGASPSIQKQPEPKYIRIKLKPDYMYGDEPVQEFKKPICLDLNDPTKKPLQSFTQIIEGEPRAGSDSSTSRSTENPGRSHSTTPTASPKPTRRITLKETTRDSKTPSPSLSRRSSFTSLFKSRETIVSPESPTIPGLKRKNTLTGILKDASDNLRDKSRSRSKSRERDKSSLSGAPSSTESIDSKSKQKSVLSIFKPKRSSTKSKSEVDSSSPEVLSSLEGLSKVEFTFNANTPNKKYYETPLHGESIRIPLHSPTYDEDRAILQELKSSSQDSQETVIDTTKCNDYIKEIPCEPESNICKIESSKRQSSTSSENVIFSTDLGSNNEIFTTKLPKDKNLKKVATDSPNEMHQTIMPQLETRPTEHAKQKSSVITTKIYEDKSKSINEHEIPLVQEPVVKTVQVINLKNERISPVPSESLAKPIASPKDTKESPVVINKKSIMSSLADEDRHSSESERDLELDYTKTKKEQEEKVEAIEPERKGLVHQQDSFEDELPYVPTTLPLERSVAVPIVPVKQRSTYEMKTYPIERPRSTTPINPSTLEDYCEDVMGAINSENITRTIEKLKISLPRDDSTDHSCKAKSPRRTVTNTTWFTFAEKGIVPQKRTSPSQEDELTPPPLPPKGAQKEWINFEEIPERRKPPRRIQTIPSRGAIDVAEAVLQENVVYSYVNPEDCKCECHETARERERQTKQQEDVVRVQEDEVPLLDDDHGEEDKSIQEPVDRIKLDLIAADRRSVISDSSVDLSTSLEHAEANNVERSLRTPFMSDLGVSSNRSSIVSQDEPQSPDITSPNAFPKTS